ncbi:hypothetical protein HDR58_07390 [bacterium]|nr:hypothetical protein [bacterium]
MGLAERFKDKLNNRDIFKKQEIENAFENKEIQFISKATEETVQNDKIEDSQTTQPETVEHQAIEIEITPTKKNPKPIEQKYTLATFEDLETEIINKIRKTPYWEEFSTIRQENMISKFFDNHINKNKTSNTDYSNNDKKEFIKNVLALSNNR